MTSTALPRSWPPFDPGAPATQAECAAALRRLLAEGDDFLAELPAAAFFARQGSTGDKWSPAEHVRHLRKAYLPVTLALHLPAFALRASFGPPRRPRREFARLSSDYDAALAAGGRAGRFEPSPERPPRDPSRRRADILRAWNRSGLALTRATERWDDSRAARARLPHPLLGGLTVGEMSAFSALHTAHHLELVRTRIG
jgi:hypothetical protein